MACHEAIEGGASQEAIAASTLGPAAAHPPKRSFLARRRDVVVDNVATHGRRVVLTQAVALIFTTVATILALQAFDGAEEGCRSGPVALKQWFLVLGVWEFMSFALFFLLLVSSVSVFSAQLERARGRRQQQQQPSGSAEPSDGPAEDEEDTCCVNGFVILTMFSMVMVMVLVMWALLGVISAVDASSNENSDTCNTGRSWFWYLFALALITLCCCNIGSAADMHTDRLAKSSVSDPVVEVMV